jgi:hypothetical protein
MVGTRVSTLAARDSLFARAFDLFLAQARTQSPRWARRNWTNSNESLNLYSAISYANDRRERS